MKHPKRSTRVRTVTSAMVKPASIGERMLALGTDSFVRIFPEQRRRALAW